MSGEALDQSISPVARRSEGVVVETPDVATVYRLYARDVTRWATRLSGRPEDALDITHEVFCLVQTRLSGFRPETGKLTTWLFRITENVVRSRRKKESLWSRLFRRSEAEDEEQTFDEAPSALERLTQRADIELVYRVLDRMKDDYRTALVLFEIEGYSGEQIAELTGTKLATVWVRLHRARAQFLEQLATLEPELAR